ncbi:helix-turn-helix domain-containing protein [Streptomyces siamensis]|uniref:HTH marR-type domain-containing protein n=1 Tax=Streptomyces siamensis TaxID=1274986 RepID=A0ABP9JDR7_9ACTN
MADRDPSDIAPQPPPILWVLGLLHGELRTVHGLALHDYLILGALAAAEGRPVPVARLTAFLGESGHRMSSLLKGLQAAGLIERERRDGDRRTVEVTLTDAGQTRFTDAEKTAQALLRPHLAPGRIAAQRSPARG